MSDLCNGCNQNERQTPLATANPPGQEALQYRLGTHPVFLQTMKNRLANLSLLNDDGARFYPLRQLTTRDSSDPAIALLDAWATVCDVLTFYQERIANEGYLPTAIERRSILELAILVGYRLKPGVAATAYLAFLLEDSFTEESLIPVGTAAQSVPGPGETPQTFETAVPLKARTVWNQLRPLATCIPIIQRDAIPAPLYLAGTSTGIRRQDPLLFQFDNGEAVRHLVANVLPELALNRTAVSLKLPNSTEQIRRLAEFAQQTTIDALDLDAHGVSSDTKTAQRVTTLLRQFGQQITPTTTAQQINQALDNLLEPLIKEQNIAAEGKYPKLGPWLNEIAPNFQLLQTYLSNNPDLAVEPIPVPDQTVKPASAEDQEQPEWLTADLLTSLIKPQALQPRNSQRLNRNAADLFKPQSDLRQKLLQSFYPRLQGSIYTALQNAPAFQQPRAQSGLQAVRPLLETAAPFGANAPLNPIPDGKGGIARYEEWDLYTENLTVTFEFGDDGSSGVETIMAAFQEGKDGPTEQINNWLTIILSQPSPEENGDEEIGRTAVPFFNPSFQPLFDQTLSIGRYLIDVSLRLPAILRLTNEIGLVDGVSRRIRVQIKTDSMVEEITLQDHHRFGYIPLNTGSYELSVFYEELTYDYYPYDTSVEESGDANYSPLAKIINYPLEIDEKRPYTLQIIGDDTCLHVELKPLSWLHLMIDVTASEQQEDCVVIPFELFKEAPLLSLSFDFKQIRRKWLYKFMVARQIPLPQIQPAVVEVEQQDYTPETVPVHVASLESRGKIILENLFAQDSNNFIVEDHHIIIGKGGSLRDTGLIPLPSLREAVLGLDGQYNNVHPGDWVVIERPNTLTPIAAEITAVHNRVYTQFNLTAKATELTLSQDWLLPTDKSLEDLRAVTVQIFSGSAELAPHPIPDIVMGDTIVLDGLYDGLETGRWIVVTGERTDVADTKGIIGKELMMISGVEIVGQGEGDPTEFNCRQGAPLTKLLLADGGLAYKYKRDTVVIYGNVVKATHGETRRDVLGSGNASQPFQTFALKQKPLTYIAAVNPTGVDSSLEVHVNDVKWPEVDSLVWLNERDRGYVTQTDNEDVTSVIFGDGKQGARLPTGQENVTAVYRYGIGQPGNVKAEQIKLLSKRPLGVSGVINPLRASGGADREKRDQARQNVPLGVMALDRLVSVQDYADFARTFAGIDKATARRVSDGLVTQILVTIAGADDIPIDETSDLFQALYQSLLELGEPQQPILLKHRQRMIVILSAEIKLEPNYLWEAVEPVLRQTILERFGFMRRQLSQPLYRSEITAVLQQHPGVSYVDVNIFDSVDELNLQTEADQLSQLLAREVELKPFITMPSAASTSLNPAYIAYLNDDIEETIILNHRP